MEMTRYAARSMPHSSASDTLRTWWPLAELGSGSYLRSSPRPVGNHIINLYDAFGPEREVLTHDFGFSALVGYSGKTILFDSGDRTLIPHAS